MINHERDCACMIVGEKYPWEYVDRLYSMLCQHSSLPIRLHILTEPDRVVPHPYIKINLDIWSEISRSNLSWWYKLQLFDQSRFSGPIMYFDLDIIIMDSIDWLWHSMTNKNHFYSVLDFRYLQYPHQKKINSSIMAWHPEVFYWIWEDFSRVEKKKIFESFPGDQDYLNQVIPATHLRFFDNDLIKSYRWQIKDGGWNFKKKIPLAPGVTKLEPNTCVVIFHGNPKPHEITESSIKKHWC